MVDMETIGRYAYYSLYTVWKKGLTTPNIFISLDAVQWFSKGNVIIQKSMMVKNKN